jgi:hypothetical protein
MNIQCLPVPSGSICYDRDNNELVLGHKVPDTTLVLWRFVSGVRLNIELERVGEGEQEEEEQNAREPLRPIHDGDCMPCAMVRFLDALSVNFHGAIWGRLTTTSLAFSKWVPGALAF